MGCEWRVGGGIPKIKVIFHNATSFVTVLHAVQACRFVFPSSSDPARILSHITASLGRLSYSTLGERFRIRMRPFKGLRACCHGDGRIGSEVGPAG